MSAPLRPLQYARRHRARFLSDLASFLRIPSVSADPGRAPDVRRCAHWLAARLRRAGLTRVQIVPTRGHPIVYAAAPRNPGRPTILIYGHYDVVPAGPSSQWRTPPFEPTVRAGAIHARGACDDKGQLFAHVVALESYLNTGTPLPVNIHCIFEGEEEIGSPNLAAFIDRNRSALRSDAAVVSDTRILGAGRPAISYSQRGVLSFEWEVRGPAHDLHSGNFGGAVHNPLQALCEMIARLHDSRGRIAIPGFYRRVRHWSHSERDYMSRTGPRDAAILRDARASRGWGERGYSLYERTTVRPALTVNGIVAGYDGPGVKAVIPSRAVAKLGFRLAPDQDPVEIERLVRRHIARITPPTVTSTLRFFASAHPAVVDRRHPALRAARFAYRKGFGAPAVFTRSGGTIPVVNTFHELLGIPTVLMGFALPNDRLHAPNEKFSLDSFFRGISTSTWFLAATGDILRRDRSIAARAPQRSLAS
jgi:acetylornithine deacetylase/succinyl-diaminopimelate desuccinylase-like protein